MNDPSLWEYLAACSNRSLQSFILERLNSAARRAKAIKAEERAMINDMKEAEVAGLILREADRLKSVLDARREDMSLPPPDSA